MQAPMMQMQQPMMMSYPVMGAGFGASPLPVTHVRQSRPDIRQARPDVRQSRPDVRQARPDVRPSRPEGWGTG